MRPSGATLMALKPATPAGSPGTSRKSRKSSETVSQACGTSSSSRRRAYRPSAVLRRYGRAWRRIVKITGWTSTPFSSFRFARPAMNWSVTSPSRW